MKAKLLVLLICISIDLYSQNSGLYDVVKISEGKSLLMKKTPAKNAETIGYIKSAYQGVPTTWNTEKSGEFYWIELKFDGLTGWVKRDEVTNSEFVSKELNVKRVDEILYRFAKAFQKGSFSDVSDLIYPVRGLALYTDKVGKTVFYSNKQLEKSWYYVADKRFTEGTTINYYIVEINKFLESDFKIEEGYKKGGELLTPELSNFTCMTAVNDKKSLSIGFEIWNGKLYVAYLALKTR